MSITWHTRSDGAIEFCQQQAFALVAGGTLPELRLVYEAHGQLSAKKDNVILIHHALSTHSHVCAHADNEQVGWWEGMVGPGCPIDTQKYFVICINNLGSCFGSSGPRSLDQHGQAYAMNFPFIHIEDMVHAQYCLLQALGISHLAAIVGPSMGGMLSLAWAVHYPDSVAKVISISSCLRSYPVNIAARQIQRDIIRLDPAWQQGAYVDDAPLMGFQLARRLGHLSYRHADELNERFKDVPADAQRGINDYLCYQAEKFTRYFDANSYLVLTAAMDAFDLRDIGLLAQINARFLLISVDSDTLFPAWQQQALFDALHQAGVPVDLLAYHSSYGHDAFLVEIQGMGQLLHDFLSMP